MVHAIFSLRFQLVKVCESALRVRHPGRSERALAYISLQRVELRVMCFELNLAILGNHDDHRVSLDRRLACLSSTISGERKGVGSHLQASSFCVRARAEQTEHIV